MPTKRSTQKYIEEELPYRILEQLYKNSRSSLRETGKTLGISYHVVQATLKKLEAKYKIRYTLELDEAKLGFAEGRIITIKFGVKPDIDFIKSLLQKDVFVQEAYLTEGDFDLLLYAVGLSQLDFQAWQWNLRITLSPFKPLLKSASVTHRVVGFLPLGNALLKESGVLSSTEKSILVLLNENARIKLNELARRAKVSPNRVIYIIKKLLRLGIIKRFSALSQASDKKLIVAFGTVHTPTASHSRLVFKFGEELLKENFHESSNDYCLILEPHGHYDAFVICTFDNGEALLRRGSGLLMNMFAEEDIKIEKAIITDVLVGMLPLHLEGYDFYRKIATSK